MLELRAGEALVRVHDRVRQPVARPPPAGLVPAARAGDDVARRVRVRDRRARPRPPRAASDRARPADLPVAPVRAGRRAHRRARGPARVRARRRRRRRLRRRTGADAAAGHRDAVPHRDDVPADARRPAGRAARARRCSVQSQAALRRRSRRRGPVRAGRRRVPPARGRRAPRRSASAPAQGTALDRRPAPRSRPSSGRRAGSSCGCSTRATSRPPSPSTGARGWLVDLRGRPVAPFEAPSTLSPWRIATARLPTTDVLRSADRLGGFLGIGSAAARRRCGDGGPDDGLGNCAGSERAPGIVGVARASTS